MATLPSKRVPGAASAPALSGAAAAWVTVPFTDSVPPVSVMLVAAAT